MSFNAADCLFDRAMEIPYLHLEDVFLIGFTGTVCEVAIYDQPKFYPLGRKKKMEDIKQWDVLFHYTQKEEFQNKFRKKIKTFSYNENTRNC